MFYVDVSNIQDEAALYRFDQDGNVIDANWSGDTGEHVGDPPERIQKERMLALALAYYTSSLAAQVYRDFDRLHNPRAI